MSAGTGRLRAADRLLHPAVQASVKALGDELAESDAALVVLAETYARAIDSADDPAEIVDSLGPKLLAALDALGATPKARAARRGGVPVAPKQGGKLAAIRDARAG